MGLSQHNLGESIFFRPKGKKEIRSKQLKKKSSIAIIKRGKANKGFVHGDLFSFVFLREGGKRTNSSTVRNSEGGGREGNGKKTDLSYTKGGLFHQRRGGDILTIDNSLLSERRATELYASLRACLGRKRLPGCVVRGYKGGKEGKREKGKTRYVTILTSDSRKKTRDERTQARPRGRKKKKERSNDSNRRS